MLATIAGLGLFEISWWGIRGVFRGFYDPILTYFNRFIHVYTQGTSDIKDLLVSLRRLQFIQVIR